MKLEGWYFCLKVNPNTDAHTTLVMWLRQRNLSHLFTQDNKQIGYFTTMHNGVEMLMARSSIEIKDPEVHYSMREIDENSELLMAVRVYATQVVRPPVLKYELPTKSKVKKVRLKCCDPEAINERVKRVVLECGLAEDAKIIITEPSQIRVFHKNADQIQYKYYVDAVISAKVIDLAAFNKAWSYGVGSKRVYGFGCMRLVEPLTKAA